MLPTKKKSLRKMFNCSGITAAAHSDVVITSRQREGRIRSAERTEVHLIATTRFHELTFCP